jgi:hypothetical protein
MITLKERFQSLVVGIVAASLNARNTQEWMSSMMALAGTAIA